MIHLNSKEKHKLFLKGEYVSYHNRVNDINSPDGLNQKGYEEVLEEMEDQGWQVVSPEDVKVGDRIRYVTYVKEDLTNTDKLKFVAGGFVRKNDIENRSISYLSGKIWGVYYDDISDMWKIEGKPKKTKEQKNAERAEKTKVRYGPIPEGDFKYTVYIGDVIVYKTNDKSKYTAFTNTSKYKKALEFGNFYVSD